ncbi:unnamed protein product [Ectocarpus sp. 12 AP-2014]
MISRNAEVVFYEVCQTRRQCCRTCRTLATSKMLSQARARGEHVLVFYVARHDPGGWIGWIGSEATTTEKHTRTKWCTRIMPTKCEETSRSNNNQCQNQRNVFLHLA